jgi:hypothetical protein
VSRHRPAAALLVAILAVMPSSLCAWGLATHRAVEEQAIETLPEPLRAYFRAHRGQIADWSVEPDTTLKERYGREEAVRHFIDLDLYGAPPFAELPRSYPMAVRRFGRDVVQSRGTVPWTIEEKHDRLVRELREGNWRAALRTAAYGGHYVADATMPLHAVSDYDGKKSGSPGVHKAVEHELVDAGLRETMQRVRAGLKPARAADYDRERIFQLVIDSAAAAPELLAADREARRLGLLGSSAYVTALDRKASRLLTARIARAVEFLGAFWLSAWEQAGRPLPPRVQ